MKQKIIIREIANCARCGSAANLKSIRNSFFAWIVICENGHTVTDIFGTKNRAVLRWNSTQKALATSLQAGHGDAWRSKLNNTIDEAIESM